MIFRSSRAYHIYMRKDESGLPEVEAVLDGFSFFAFLFSVFWALFNRLWIFAAIIAAARGGLIYLEMEGEISRFSAAISLFMINIWTGLEASNWLQSKRESEGYEFAVVIYAANGIEAEQRFWDRYHTRQWPCPAL